MAQPGSSRIIRGPVAASDEIAMSQTAPYVDAANFERRARKLGADMRAALEPLVAAVQGPAARTTAFATALGLDKSLAGKIVRVTRAADPLEVLHTCPAPQGLSMVIRAAESRGVPAEVCQRVQTCVDDFREILSEFVGGARGVRGRLVRPDPRGG